MTWKKEIEELKKREKLAEAMGGPEKLQRQKDNKRLNVRERIDLLLDKDSFHEIGKIAGKASYDKTGELEKFIPSNFVMGRGSITVEGLWLVEMTLPLEVAQQMLLLHKIK